LTPERIDAANQLGRRRSSSFHAEQRLPIGERAEPDDYRRSGFDRGHMSPSGDMSTDIAQNESFSLANMVPQNPCHNEVMWEGIESAVRALALDTEVFVITGPAFSGDEIQTLDERVFVPTNIFKAVFLPSRNAAGAYWTPNDTSQKQEHISIARLTDLTGIDVFPRLDVTAKDTAMALPGGKPHHGCRTHISP
jgi:endonuclease G